MINDISDLPTTVRETLSEAKLELYLRAHRRAYEALTQDETEKGSRQALAHQKAMREVERTSEHEEVR
jgi:cation transport regulator ChaB